MAEFHSEALSDFITVGFMSYIESLHEFQANVQMTIDMFEIEQL